MTQTRLIVGEELPERLDLFLARKFPKDFSRTRLKEMITAGLVLVNGKSVKPHYVVKEGDSVTLEIVERETMDTRGEDIPLDILYEDQDILVVNKAAGMVVHPAYGNFEHTLVNALIHHTREQLSSLGGTVRPGIVHRLDKDTSGVLVVAKNDFSHRSLAKQFKSHSLVKIYWAVVKGVVQHDELKCEEAVGRAFLNRKKVVVKPSGGKEALTFFRVLERLKDATFIEARPQTGRTHQIRVHLASLGHPIVGDSLYGGGSPLIKRHSLHAASLEITHPRTEKRMIFKSDLPEDMQQLLVALGR